jgi:hypothetical protein
VKTPFHQFLSVEISPGGRVKISDLVDDMLKVTREKAGRACKNAALPCVP